MTREPWFVALRARVVNALIRRWQAHCEHDPRLARADILEGDGMNLAVSWCPVCGAYQRGWQTKGSSDWTWGEWRSPRADFKAWLGIAPHQGDDDDGLAFDEEYGYGGAPR